MTTPGEPWSRACSSPSSWRTGGASPTSSCTSNSHEGDPMQDGTSTLHRWLAAGLCLLVLAIGAGSGPVLVNVAVNPQSEVVAPGSDFDVFLDIATAESGFNGWSVVLSYDPAVLALVPASPTKAQEGCLMTGACSDACGETFHQFSAAGDSIAVSDVLLCNLVSIRGPGHLYRLRFHALGGTPVTRIGLRRVHFYGAGTAVRQVTTREAGIAIGATTGVGGGPAAPPELRLEPNPAFGRVSIVADADRDGWAQAEILDLQGRVVRRLGPQWLGARERLEWDRADARGVRAPAGVYLVRVHRAGTTRD